MYQNIFSKKLLFSLGLTLSTVSALAVSPSYNNKFSSLQNCTTYFNNDLKTKNPGDTATSYCSNKVMSSLEICIDNKVNDYLKANKLNAFSEMTNTEQLSKQSKFNYECQLQAQQAAANADQQRRAASGGSGGSNSNSAASALAGAGAAVAIAQTGIKVSENIDKKIEEAQKAQKASEAGTSAAKATTDGSTAAAGSASSSSAVNSSAATNSQPATANSGASSESQYSLSSGSDKQGIRFDEGSNSTRLGDSHTTTKLGDSGSQADVAAGNAAKSDLTGDISSLKSTSPDLAKQAESFKNADGSFSDVPVSEIKTASDAANAQYIQGIQTGTATGKPALAGGTTPPFVTFGSLLSEINTSSQSYINTKNTCVEFANKSEFLCIESKSPGAIATRELMNASGPVLSALSSAQKSCSSTSKVTKLVTTGLTVAKGVCVGAKLGCDITCGKAAANLKTITAAVEKLQAAAARDNATGKTTCAGLTVAAGACYAELESKNAAANAAIGQLRAAVNSENSTKMGSSTQLVAQCQKYGKDIALFAVQLIGTAAAYQNAKACEKSLASSNNPGATVQQYCDQPANASMQVCVCQKNNMAAGCPGALAAQSNSNNNSDKGTNIKSIGGGNSGFAGPTTASKSKPTSGSQPGVNGGSTDLNKDLKTSPNNSGSDAGTTGSVASGGAGGGSVGSNRAGDAAGGAGADAVKADEKGWSYGSFSGSGGTSFSAGSGSGKNRGSDSGSLSAKDMQAVKRQIASEEFSAQVSTASGKSNWEKVRSMYLLKEDSFDFSK